MWLSRKVYSKNLLSLKCCHFHAYLKILSSATIQLSSTWTCSLSHSPVHGVCHRHSKSPKTQILQGSSMELGGTWKEFRSLWGGVCASNELCLIYNIACTDAAAFQKVPLKLHWRIEQFYPASSLSLYVSISLYWREMLERKKNPFLTFFFWVPYVLQNQIEHMLRRWQVGTKAGRIRLLIAAKNSYTSNHCKPALLTEWWKADNTLPSRVRLS